MRLSTRLLRQLLVALLLMVGQVASPLSATGNATAASSHRDRPSSLLAPSSMAAASAGTPAIEFLNSLGGDIPSAAIDGTLAYVIEGNTLAVVDVSNPAAPLLRGRVPTQARDDADVVVAGGHAYVTREQMLEIIDVSNPAAPRVVGSYKTSLSYIKTIPLLRGRVRGCRCRRSGQSAITRKI
jgi:hypothetical protein